MNIYEASALSRRRALKLGAQVAGGMITASTFTRNLAFADVDPDAHGTTPSQGDQDTIQDILQAQGTASDGVFSVEIDRDDINDVMLHGVPILPSFEINGSVYFQRARGGKLYMNGDMALKASELDPFIHALISRGIVFQAEHQHFYDFSPMVWFVHYRAAGTAEWLATNLKGALDQTSTPFPQTMPSNPTTPLPADEIGRILGATPQIGADGVVTYDIPRKERLMLGGYWINPYLNTATTIAFEPLGGGTNAAVVPDYNFIASEINRVVSYTQSQGWDIGCLYNQETDEYPQLYFSHQFKTGNAIVLAQEIRNALNLMNVRFE